MEQTNIELEIVLALLRREELHIRALARYVNQPHANISRAMKSLLKENVVDFKVEGKNKLFRLKKGIESLNYAYIAEHYKLIKLLEKYPLLSIIVESILSKTNERLVIIFGSYAKFIAKKESDIDVFVETMKRSVKKELENINSKLSVKIGKFDKNNLLIKEIVKNHVIVKGVEYYYEKNKLFD